MLIFGQPYPQPSEEEIEVYSQSLEKGWSLLVGATASFSESELKMMKNFQDKYRPTMVAAGFKEDLEQQGALWGWLTVGAELFGKVTSKVMAEEAAEFLAEEQGRG